MIAAGERISIIVVSCISKARTGQAENLDRLSSIGLAGVLRNPLYSTTLLS